MMPGVEFNDYTLNLEKHNHWLEAYLSNDLFLCETPQGLVAHSIEYLHRYNFSHHKYNGSFFSLNGEPLSQKIMIQFIARLYKHHRQMYSEVESCRKKIVEIKQSSMTLHDAKYDGLFQELEKLLLLSFTSEGLNNTFHNDLNLHNILSAYAYENFSKNITTLLTTEEQVFLSSIPAKRIDGNGTKNIGEIIQDAFNSFCTSTLGLYWLGLIKEYRPQTYFNVSIDTHKLSNELDELQINIQHSTLKSWIECSRNSLMRTLLNFDGQQESKDDLAFMPRFGF